MCLWIFGSIQGCQHVSGVADSGQRGEQGLMDLGTGGLVIAGNEQLGLPWAVLGVDSCPVRPQVCAAGGDWAGLGPGVSQLCNSLSLFASLQRKSPCLAVCSLQTAEPSPEVPQCLCDPCQCHPRSLCHPPAEGWELCGARGTSPLEKLLLDCRSAEGLSIKEWLEGLKKQNRE